MSFIGNKDTKILSNNLWLLEICAVSWLVFMFFVGKTYPRAIIGARNRMLILYPIESLCFLGKRCMGALEFEPAIDVSYNKEAKFEIDKLVEVANEALAEKSSFDTNLGDDKKAAIAEILRLGTSAGSQRAKAINAYNKETGEVRSGLVASNSIWHQILRPQPISHTSCGTNTYVLVA